MIASPRTEPSVAKAATGVVGLDELSGGGLPRGRTTLLTGGPGSGKTVLALQTLVHGAAVWREPAIFVAFEEQPARLIQNAGAFGWNIPSLQRRRLFFLDAILAPDVVHSGGFDFSGLLAMLAAKAKAMRATRIVFDAVDVLFGFMGDAQTQQREMFRLHQWLLEHEFTAIITAKADLVHGGASAPLHFLPYMTDCSVELHHDMVAGVSQRSIRIAKLRGSAFSENASPMLIGNAGIEVAGRPHPVSDSTRVSNERISSGIARLDAMLEGGFHRGSSILVTGAPGTSKTTLAGALVDAACRRGEAALFVSYDSESAEIVRNLGSVGLKLGVHERSGRLRFLSLRSGAASAEAQLIQILGAMRDHKAQVLVIDPISAMGKLGNEDVAHGVIERLVDGAKSAGITVFCCSLLGRSPSEYEGSPIQISTIADTWIHLTYQAKGGERNRALTIVKSRGTAHSNQVRELLLSREGITLADPYTGEGEVLMGTMRFQHEAMHRAADEAASLEIERRRREIRHAMAALRRQMDEISREVNARESDLARLDEAERATMAAKSSARSARVRQRSTGGAAAPLTTGRKPRPGQH